MQQVTGKIETPAQFKIKGAKAVKILKFPKAKEESKETITVTINSNARRVNELRAAYVTPKSEFALDVSGAIEVDVNTVYQVGTFGTGAALLVKTSTKALENCRRLFNLTPPLLWKH